MGIHETGKLIRILPVRWAAWAEAQVGLGRGAGYQLTLPMVIEK